MATSSTTAFSIGTPGKPWGVAEREEWRRTRPIQRSYKTECVDKLFDLFGDDENFEVIKYGALKQDPERYPLYAVKVGEWDASRPHVLVTGGVHGYETSGVQGAIALLSKDGGAIDYADKINLLVVPCVSPWGYETIQRWNHEAVDPNRSFNPDGEVVPDRRFNPEPATDESRNLIEFLNTLGVEKWLCHVDLHETTDTDETEFRPVKAARDGKDYSPDAIPDGFYLVSDSTNPQTGWHKAMIEGVKKVTHIAPPDDDGNIIGEKMVQEGVIAIPSPRLLGLCSGVTNVEYATTTEVYPDSEKATDEQCNRAQVACVRSGLDYIIKEKGL